MCRRTRRMPARVFALADPPAHRRAQGGGAAPGSLGRTGGIASERMRELYGLIRAVAPTPTTVHLHGESGAGKELVARTLHTFSGRTGPLVVFDASVADPEMVRNDLFGHIKGAFTGATGSREGAFRQAHTGTLFIDEIGELPLDLQPRLLRVLETREVTPIGSDKASGWTCGSSPPPTAIWKPWSKTGAFRADLFYRLSVVPIDAAGVAGDARGYSADRPHLMPAVATELPDVGGGHDRAARATHGPATCGNCATCWNGRQSCAAIGKSSPEDLRLCPRNASSSKEPAPVQATPCSTRPRQCPASPPNHHRDPQTQCRRCPHPSQGHGTADDSGRFGAQLSTTKPPSRGNWEFRCPR
jgi:hypothetical protein